MTRHSVESFPHNMNETFSSCTIGCKKKLFDTCFIHDFANMMGFISHVTTNLFDTYQP